VALGPRTSLCARCPRFDFSRCSIHFIPRHRPGISRHNIPNVPTLAQLVTKYAKIFNACHKSSYRRRLVPRKRWKCVSEVEAPRESAISCRPSRDAVHRQVDRTSSSPFALHEQVSRSARFSVKSQGLLPTQDPYLINNVYSLVINRADSKATSHKSFSIPTKHIQLQSSDLEQMKNRCHLYDQRTI
jgi:hypothetical protein